MTQIAPPTPTEVAPDPATTGSVSPLKRAVIYLRVSTAKQADNAESAEGYSLPAQREACYRKAEALGAEVVTEYIDRGESAKTADRPQFQRMVSRIKTDGDVDYVILDKIDRFARNRRDDANMLFELQLAGAQLVSVKENIDETPAGQLLHAIMAGIAEFYSRNLATEALKGMTQKAKFGGTPGRAPIGYLNIGRRVDGREVRMVAVDPDRAPLVQWAFEAYSSGEWTISTLTEALAAKGLRALPQGSSVPGPIPRGRVAHLLSNRYYVGYVTFRGVEYQGRHQLLVPQSLFDRVQEVLRSHRSGEKQRTHRHYLRSTVFCAHCGSRLCFTLAKGVYPYFFCVGRQQRRFDCPQRHIPAELLEQAVADHYRGVRLPEKVQHQIRDGLQAELAKQGRQAGPEIAWARRRVVELEAERRRLARGVVDGSIPGDLAREEQDRIDIERGQAQRILAAAEMVFARIEDTLNRALSLVGRVDEVYRLGGPQVRRLSNQFFFEKLLVKDNEVVGAVLREPWSTLLAEDFIEQMGRNATNRNATNPGRVLMGQGSKTDRLVPSA